MSERVPFLDEVTLDFIDKLLILNPAHRMNCKQALEHEYFKTEPLPCELSEMPRVEEECHITLMTEKRKKASVPNDDSVTKKRKNSEIDRRNSFHNNNPPPPMKSPEIESDYISRYQSDQKPRPPLEPEERKPEPPSLSTLFNKGQSDSDRKKKEENNNMNPLDFLNLNSAKEGKLKKKLHV